MIDAKRKDFSIEKYFKNYCRKINIKNNKKILKTIKYSNNYKTQN